MRTRVGIVGVLGVAALAAGMVEAKGAAVTINGAGIRQTVDCAGGSVVVTGANNELTLKGDCEKVTLSGTGHVIHAEGLGRVSVSGVNNVVEWQRALRGQAPSVDDSGIGNEVRRVKGARGGTQAASGGSRNQGSVAIDDSGVTVKSEGGEVSVTSSGVKAKSGDSRAEVSSSGVKAESGGSRATVGAGGIEAENDDDDDDSGLAEINGVGVRRTIRCAGGGITVNGTNHVLRLEGDCSKVVVNGMGSHVKVEAAGVIVVNGMNQRVEWVRGIKNDRPTIQRNGMGHDVVQITAEEFSKR